LALDDNLHSTYIPQNIVSTERKGRGRGGEGERAWSGGDTTVERKEKEGVIW
jgi:hypothetical protein